MSRKRFITSDMSTDERLAGIAAKDPLAAALWPWFLTALDDWGRAKFAPVEIKLSVFPAYPFDASYVEQVMKMYHEAGLIQIYEVDGKRYWCVPFEKWLKYQTYLDKQRLQKYSSKYPPPPDSECRDMLQHVATLRDNAENFVLSLSLSDSLNNNPPNTNVFGGEASAEPDGSGQGQEEENTSQPLQENHREEEQTSLVSRKKTEKKRKQTYGEAERALVDKMREWRRQQNCPPTQRDWHLRELAIAAKLLKTYSVQELEEAFLAAQQDEYWRTQLDSWATVERFLPRWRLQKSRDSPRKKPLVDEELADQIADYKRRMEMYYAGSRKE